MRQYIVTVPVKSVTIVVNANNAKQAADFAQSEVEDGMIEDNEPVFNIDRSQACKTVRA
jgi:hypothetical protein